jgi:hypothetical protein
LISIARKIQVALLALCLLAGQVTAAVPKICPMQFETTEQFGDTSITEHAMHNMHDMPIMSASNENLASDNSVIINSATENCCSQIGHCSISGCSLIGVANTLKHFDFNQFSQVVDFSPKQLVIVTTDSLYRPPILS